MIIKASSFFSLSPQLLSKKVQNTEQSRWDIGFVRRMMQKYLLHLILLNIFYGTKPAGLILPQAGILIKYTILRECEAMSVTLVRKHRFNLKAFLFYEEYSLRDTSPYK